MNHFIDKDHTQLHSTVTLSLLISSLLTYNPTTYLVLQVSMPQQKEPLPDKGRRAETLQQPAQYGCRHTAEVGPDRSVAKTITGGI